MHPYVRIIHEMLYAHRAGACVVRSTGPDPWMWAVVALHALLIGTIVLWPVLMRREFDAVILLLIAVIVLQWITFRGECLLSVLEKRLLYVEYRMGDAPLRQWFHELLPPPVATAVSAGAWGAMICAVISVLYRNVFVTPPQSIRLEVVWPVNFTAA